MAATGPGDTAANTHDPAKARGRVGLFKLPLPKEMWHNQQHGEDGEDPEHAVSVEQQRSLVGCSDQALARVVRSR